MWSWFGVLIVLYNCTAVLMPNQNHSLENRCKLEWQLLLLITISSHLSSTFYQFHQRQPVNLHVSKFQLNGRDQVDGFTF